MILNNDTGVDRDFVSALVAESRRAPDAGALCSKIFYGQSRDTVWFSGASFDPRRGYNGRQRGYRQRDVGGDTCVTETDRACAAAMLVPRSVIERVGFFDPDLFACSEDTDWSLRAKAAGYRLLVVPASRVWHRVSASSGGRARRRRSTTGCATRSRCASATRRWGGSGRGGGDSSCSLPTSCRRPFPLIDWKG